MGSNRLERAEWLQLCLTLCDLWTVARQATLSMGFSRQRYCSGLPYSLPRDLPNPRINSYLWHESKNSEYKLTTDSMDMSLSKLGEMVKDRET